MSSQLFELEESADDILLDETVSDTVPTETTIVLDDDTAENNIDYTVMALYQVTWRITYSTVSQAFT